MRIDSLQIEASAPRNWLVTGCAGFIGANLVEYLLCRNQNVAGIDNFTSGSLANLEMIKKSVSDEQWDRFQFKEGDIRSVEDCEKACRGAEYVLHQAALSSPVEAEASPALAIDTNIRGFANILESSIAAGARRIVYASSCSVYGSTDAEVQAESDVPDPNTVYAITKHADELFAKHYSERLGTSIIGLRYFNCYGKFQAAQSGYTAFIPKCVAAILSDEPFVINGDGETTRDFIHVDDVARANVIAALSPDVSGALVYNVGTGSRTSLNTLFEQVRLVCSEIDPTCFRSPEYGPFRENDIKHSRADTVKAYKQLDFEARTALSDGIRRVVQEAITAKSGKLYPRDGKVRKLNT